MAVALGAKLSKQLLPSQKLAVRSAHPFVRRPLSAFGRAYVAGSIPCRINHGSVISKLQWDQSPSSMKYDPLLVTLSEGLLETEHPYAFVARTGFENLLEAQGAAAKVIPLLSRLVPPLRASLGHSSKNVFKAGLKAIRQVSMSVGAAFDPYLNVLLVQINKKIFDKSLYDEIQETLHTLEKSGLHAFYVIKSKVPTYSSAFNNGSPQQSSRSSLRASSSGTIKSTCSSSRS